MASPTWLRLPAAVSMTLLVVCACLVSPATAGDWHGDAIHVNAGESIQAAIDTAKPGQMIIVEAGTYAEQLAVGTDGLRLVSKGAVLVPPHSPVQNTCSGLAGPDTEAGICVTGQNIELADFVVEHRKVLSVGQPVKDVVVAGFQVQGFSGLNIAVVGGQAVQVVGNTLQDGTQYGVLTVGSKSTHIDANIVASTGDLLYIGVCMDDLSDVQITNNHVTNYAVGLCVQTDDAYLYNNQITDTCWGVFVDPGTLGVHVLGNHISSPNPICATFPDPSLSGVLLAGASGTEIKGNTVEDMTAGGVPNVLAGGIGIVDDPITGETSSGNTVTGNVLRNNDIDIYVQTNGTGNVVVGNQCTTPAELCS
ncbi:hypothetical protein PV04_04527 [Phialophora macrospora]|uniref:Right handed beta helix domain-containing protein n=1 Tax=Phialophora macrospora TaxID=1851006 RepID=A0A0D2G9J5_9EURO|nr:hypothetical protein PV04_04527 [Phialophora macrospora]